MRVICHHEWRDEARVFTAPPRRQVSLDSGAELMKQILFGVTSIRQRCVKCRKLREATFVGDHTTPMNQKEGPDVA